MEKKVKKFMRINCNIYWTKTCSVVVPKELCVSDGLDKLKAFTVDEYARLKDGIEVTSDSLSELIQSDEFNDISFAWQEFLKEVLKIEADTYILHN